MGGLANAVFWMLGPDECDQMLKEPIPIPKHFWMEFNKTVNNLLIGYELRRLKCGDILCMDDSLPVVVQLRATEKSESHAVCIYRDCIFDSASRYVLEKSSTALNWCCSPSKFECHLRLYRLQQKEISVKKQKKKRRRDA